MSRERRLFWGNLVRRLSGRSWREPLRGFLSTWNRGQIPRLGIAILVVWVGGATAVYLAERGDGSPAFATWGGSLWNVWGLMFSGPNEAPTTGPGRVAAGLLLIAGVALAGLFTASVASVLVERALRTPDVSSLEMSEHLVLCNWAPRGLEWIREVRSTIVKDKRPVVIIHDEPDDIELPDKADDPAFSDVYIVRGDPINEVILRRAKVPLAHSVVVLSDDRQGVHADGKTIITCIAVRNVCRGEPRPNLVVECRDPKYRPHVRKAGADEIISATEFGLRLLARAALFHGMTRVYQELLTVGRDANELYMIPVPAGMIGRPFVEVAESFLRHRNDTRSCLVVGVYRGEVMHLNPVGAEAGPLREGDELILMSQVYPDPSKPLPTDPPQPPVPPEPREPT